jgi:recombination protein RecA
MSKKEQGKEVSHEDIIKNLEKKYNLSKAELKDNVVVSTGSLQLDQAMGMGGTVLGKVVEIYGPESSGKSTITIHQMVEYQKAFPGKKVALFDYENSFDKKYAINLGLSVDDVLIYQPEDLESGYDMILALIQTGFVSCIVLDSQTAAPPKAILQGEMGDATIGLQARLNSKFCLKVKGILTIHKCTLFIISQTRDKIGSMGESTGTTGGNAFKFYADVRWKIWKMNDKDNELNKTTIDVIKNKLASPFGQAKVNILWGKGFDNLLEIINYAEEFGYIDKGGSWFTYKTFKCQGLPKLKNFLEENSDELIELEKLVLMRLASPDYVVPTMDPEVIKKEA